MGYWGKKTLIDYWNECVKKHGNREYIVDDIGNRYTYKEVDEKAGAIASYFVEIGIKPLDIVSFQLPVWSEFIFLTVACIKLGAIINPIGMCYNPEEVSKLLNQTESKLYICPTLYHNTNYEEVISSIKKNVKKLKTIILVDKLKEKKVTIMF
ncbi:acyl-CoA synthetase [Clostridium saccharobutylicum]|nr:AMP-binding protein [Clostridium saccharobutylicum]NOW60242.1 acyl-CoA synthetase [Clostridium saccharobutylicum]